MVNKTEAYMGIAASVAVIYCSSISSQRGFRKLAASTLILFCETLLPAGSYLIKLSLHLY